MVLNATSVGVARRSRYFLCMCGKTVFLTLLLLLLLLLSTLHSLLVVMLQNSEQSVPSQHFNLGSTFFQRWKSNKIRRRIFNIVQCSCNVSTRCWNNVETTLSKVNTTLYQGCFIVDSTLVRTIPNPVGLLMIMDLWMDE